MSALYVRSDTEELERVVRKVRFILKIVLEIKDTPTHGGREKSQVDNSAKPPGSQGQVGLEMGFASLLGG